MVGPSGMVAPSGIVGPSGTGVEGFGVGGSEELLSLTGVEYWYGSSVAT